MIKAGIIGATGYAGSELLRILSAHPEVAVEEITSQSYAQQNYGDIFENFSHCENLVCGEENIKEMADRCDVIFLALPHGIASKKLNKQLLEKVKIIDLGADYRISDYQTYEHWYQTGHASKELLSEAVYGLCELNREKIKSTQLVASPGCYTSCSILSLYPLIKEGIIDTESIIIDAKSGVSGAGRSVGLGTHFNETNESVKAYKIGSHRHTPEIEEQLSTAAGKKLQIQFTPHLIPMNRGILSTCYAKLLNNYSDIGYDGIKEIYKQYYGKEYFIRLTKKGVFPETRWVKGSNFMDIGIAVDERTNRVIIVGALDNLVKGAAGQAVQNMNIMFDINEKTGIDSIPVFPI